ncbi:MAG: polyprenyl synthetase family protein [Elusimicrobia bacterium]|nr:polyprenyl synthetase family protein [Elusimicrobiota bacterium]
MANTATVDSIEQSLTRVREGLSQRSLALGGRIGEQLAAFITRPGKMLRARFCVHLGASLGVDPKAAESAGQIAELIHNASLLHDDCIDGATTRRSRATPNALFNTTTGILLGDLAFTQALDEALALSPGALRGIVDAVREMTVGEIQEEFLRGSIDVTEESYYGVAARKTGALFEWCARCMSDMSPLPHDKESMPKLGRSAGILLQIVDDIHDFTLDSRLSGKDAAQDLSGSRLTLPSLLALKDPTSSATFLKIWSKASSEPNAAKELAKLLNERGHLDEARSRARATLMQMVGWVKALPNREQAKELADFMESMARRQF